MDNHIPSDSSEKLRAKMAFTFKVDGFKQVANGLMIQLDWNGVPMGLVVENKAAAIDYLTNHPPTETELLWVVMRCWQAHDPTFANPNLIVGKTLTFDPNSNTAPMTLA